MRATGTAAGSATVELAAAVPLLVAVTLAMISLLGLARDQVLAQGAAREGAREAAIGGDHTRAAAAARAALPPGRAVRVVVEPVGPDRVRVSVEPPSPCRSVSVRSRHGPPRSPPASPDPPRLPRAHDQAGGDPGRSWSRPDAVGEPPAPASPPTPASSRRPGAPR
jgi:hypothetical protein